MLHVGCSCMYAACRLFNLQFSFLRPRRRWRLPPAGEVRAIVCPLSSAWPASLPLERSSGSESMRGWSVWRRLLWSEVHHWHDPPASLHPGSPLQPWHRPLPAAAHSELSVEECIRPADPECNTIVFFFFFFFIHDREPNRRPPPHLPFLGLTQHL